MVLVVNPGIQISPRENWDYIWTKIEKRFEKHVSVRILRGSLAQSIREEYRGSTTLLGA